MIDFNDHLDIAKLNESALDCGENIVVYSPPKKKRGRPPKNRDAAVTYVPKPKTQATKTGGISGPEPLSEADRKYIEENARGISVDEMADTLGKRRSTVFNYMDKHGLLGEDDKRDSRIKRAILNDLHNQKFWENTIKAGYTQDEIEYFEEYWCSFVIQLDDNIAPTEQMQLKTLIENQIRIDRLTVNERRSLDGLDARHLELQELQDRLQKTSDDYEIEEIRDRVGTLTGEIASEGMRQQSIEKDRDTLVKANSNLMKDLDVTRARRVEKYDVTDKTWSKLLLEIKENPRLKKQLSAYSYVSFLATERMKGLLTKPYLYADGEERLPMTLPEEYTNHELAEMIESYVPRDEEEEQQQG